MHHSLVLYCSLADGLFPYLYLREFTLYFEGDQECTDYTHKLYLEEKNKLLYYAL